MLSTITINIIKYVYHCLNLIKYDNRRGENIHRKDAQQFNNNIVKRPTNGIDNYYIIKIKIHTILPDS